MSVYGCPRCFIVNSSAWGAVCPDVLYMWTRVVFCCGGFCFVLQAGEWLQKFEQPDRFFFFFILKLFFCQAFFSHNVYTMHFWNSQRGWNAAIVRMLHETVKKLIAVFLEEKLMGMSVVGLFFFFIDIMALKSCTVSICNEKELL